MKEDPNAPSFKSDLQALTWILVGGALLGLLAWSAWIASLPLALAQEIFLRETGYTIVVSVGLVCCAIGSLVWSFWEPSFLFHRVIRAVVAGLLWLPVFAFVPVAVVVALFLPLGSCMAVGWFGNWMNWHRVSRMAFALAFVPMSVFLFAYIGAMIGLPYSLLPGAASLGAIFGIHQSWQHLSKSGEGDPPL